MDVLRLRVHHLLCSILYEGAGYSESFVENMNGVVAALKNPETRICLVTGADSICAGCPNAMDDGGCALDDDIKEKCVDCLDIRILNHTKLTAGKIYPAKEAIMQAASHMDAAFFEQCCSECRWYLSGYCSYSKYEQNVNNYFL